MESESTLHPGELMNTDNQLDSTLCILESPDTSFSNTLEYTKEPIGVNWTSNLLEGALFIVSNGTYQNENIPSYWQHPADLLTHTFHDVAKLNNHPEYFFHDLIKAYADLYKIDLHLIIYNNNKYVIIDKKNFFKPNEEPYNHEKHAFIWCNADNTVYSPLFINDVNGHILTVFKTDEVFAWQCVESFVNRINQELANADRNQTEQCLNLLEEDLSHMVVDNTFSSTNNSTSLATLQTETTSKGHAFVEQMLQQISQLTNNLKPQLDKILLGNEVLDLNIKNLDQLSPQVTAALLQQRLMLISEVCQMVVEQTPQNDNNTISSDIVAENNNHQVNAVQLNETTRFEQAGQNFANDQPSVSTHLSNTTQVLQTIPAPEILIRPKQKWHYRNMKDLGKNQIPLLAGNGPQRTLIRVKIPRQAAHPMHLGVRTLTHDDREHRSKILVPEHTSVNMDSFCNDNNFDRLQFDQCNPLDYFDPVNRCVYLAISPEEHIAQAKDLRMHMFNLYQNGSITREMVETEQLEKCKLAFWLCTLKAGVYEPISPSSLSYLIEES